MQITREPQMGGEGGGGGAGGGERNFDRCIKLFTTAMAAVLSMRPAVLIPHLSMYHER